MRSSRPIAVALTFLAATAAYACSSEKSDEGASVTPAPANLGGCYPTDPKCTIAGSKCQALIDNSASNKKTLRISQLKVSKPAALASTTINFTIIGPAVTIQDNDACHLRPGLKAGTFNWLMEFDLTDPAKATLRTGGARPVKDVSAGYCFLTDSIGGSSLAPQTIPIVYDKATGAFSTGEGKALTVPIFLDQEAKTTPILLPLQGVKITNGKLTENGNCIGRFRGDVGELDSACQTLSSDPTDPQAFQFEKGADLEGYITAEEADKVKIVDLSQSLCSFLSNVREPCVEDSSFKCCRRGADGKVDLSSASGKPDFSSTGQKACSGTPDCDAYLLGTELSAAAVKINDTCNLPALSRCWRLLRPWAAAYLEGAAALAIFRPEVSMARLIKKIVFTSLFGLVACGGGGGGCNSGCAGVAPLPNGFPAAERIDNSASLRLTDKGFAFLSANLGTIAGPLVGGSNSSGVLEFPIAGSGPMDLGGIGKACPNGSVATASPPECIIEIGLAKSKLVLGSGAPHNLKVGGTIPIRAQRIPVTAAGFDLRASLGNAGCSGGVNFADVEIDADISVETDKDPSHGAATGLSKIKILKLDPKLKQEQVQLCADCTNILCTGILNPILGGLKNALFGTLVDQIKKPLNDQLATALCSKGSTDDPATACPAGSAPEDPKDPKNSNCVYPDKSCVGPSLGMDGHFDLGAALASVSPTTKGGLDFQFALGGLGTNPDAPSLTYGDLNPVDKGATLSLVGGAIPSPKGTCIVPVDLAKPTGIPTPDELLGNSVSGWPAGLDGPHFGLGLSEAYTNYALGGVYNSGALCIQITTENVAMLDAGKISLLAPSMKTLQWQKQNQQVGIVIRPQEPPKAAFGNGTNLTTDANIMVDLNKFALDIYVFSSDRFVRAFTVTLDMTIPLNLDVGADGKLTPMLDKINVKSATVTNNQFLAEKPETIGTGFKELLAGLAGQFLGGINPIDLGSLTASLGLKLVIPPSVKGQGSPGVRKLSKNGFNHLGLFGTLQIAPAVMTSLEVPLPTASSTSTAVVLDRRVTREGVNWRTFTPENAPVIDVLAASSIDDGSRALEYSYKVDKGMWHPWSDSRSLHVKDDILRIQAKHTVTVRSRVVGMPETEGPPVVMPVIVDVEPPLVALSREGDRYKVEATDVVSEPDALVGRTKLDDGPYTDWLPLAALDRVAVEGAKLLTVEVRDEEGHVGSITQELRGRPDKTGQTAGSGGCGCTVPGKTEGSLPLFGALGIAGVLAFLRMRRRRLAEVAAGAAVMSVSGTWAGCLCSSSDSTTEETPSEQGGAGGAAGAAGAGGSVGGQAPATPEVVKQGLIGSYTSVAVTAAGKAWVAGYNEADYDNSHAFGDLVAGTVEGDKVKWTTVDGYDPSETVDPMLADPNSWRGGRINAGPDVGLWTSIAIGDGDQPQIAYFDFTKASLKYATFDGTKWSTHVVETKEKSSYGRYAKLLMIDGKPVISYLAMESAADGSVTSNVKVIRAKSAKPGATADWGPAELVLEKGAAIPCRALFCATGNKCNATSNKCEKPATTCTPKCGSGEDCFTGAMGAPAKCEPIRSATFLDSYPEATGLYVSAAVTSKKDVGLVFYDRVRGDLWKAERGASGKWEPKLVLGQDAMGLDSGDVGIGASLAIDKTGDWHVTFVDGSKEALWYAKLAAGAVPPAESKVVDAGDDPASPGKPFADGTHIVGDDSSLLIDPTGTVRVVYQDATAATLRVATRGADGAWTRKIIPVKDMMSGFFPQQMVVGGKVQIAHYARNNGLVPVGDVAITAP